MAIDNTKGEVKLVRGSGPPILTSEGTEMGIADVVFALRRNSYQPSLPLTCRVTGIDLTRRTVRLQVIGAGEIVYTADGQVKNSGAIHCEQLWVFESAETARVNVVHLVQEMVKQREAAADLAIDALQKAKTFLANATAWEPRDPGTTILGVVP